MKRTFLMNSENKLIHCLKFESCKNLLFEFDKTQKLLPQEAKEIIKEIDLLEEQNQNFTQFAHCTQFADYKEKVFNLSVKLLNNELIVKIYTKNKIYLFCVIKLYDVKFIEKTNIIISDKKRYYLTFIEFLHSEDKFRFIIKSDQKAKNYELKNAILKRFIETKKIFELNDIFNQEFFYFTVKHSDFIKNVFYYEFFNLLKK